MEELQAAGGRVAMVQLLQILRRYSSSSATGRKRTCRSRLCGSTICLRPGSEETSSSPSTTSSNTLCLRRGSFEVQGYNNCIPAVDDVDQLLIGGQWWDDVPTGQFGICNTNFGPQQRRCLSQSDMKFLLISGTDSVCPTRYTDHEACSCFNHTKSDQNHYTFIEDFCTRLIFELWNHLIGAGSFGTRLIGENELNL